MYEPTVTELQMAKHDLERALQFSFVDNNGKITSYEYNGTSKVIPLAIMALVYARRDLNERQ